MYSVIKYNMDKNMMYGRYCKSGIAVIMAASNEMMCVEISSVKSNIDAYAAA